MGKTIGVVGLGRIGREVANWCMNFGMHAVGYDPILTDDAALAAGIEPVSLDEVSGSRGVHVGRLLLLLAGIMEVAKVVMVVAELRGSASWKCRRRHAVEEGS